MNALLKIGRKGCHAVLLVLSVVVLNFLLIRMAPGDPVETIAGTMGGMSDQLRTQLIAEYGLDQPLWKQLAVYVGRVAHGDLGMSYFFNLPVADLILDRLPATLLLVVASVVTAFVIGTALGVFAARKPHGLLSQAITVLSMMGNAAPVFWSGMMLVIVFASAWPILPVSDMRSMAADSTGLAGVLDVAWHMVLPTVTLSLVHLAQYSRLARASVLDLLGADYIRTARAKGVSEAGVFYVHALRNALLPVVTVLGLQFGNVIAGAILVETVFNWPGLGRLAFDSILRRDYPTVLGILLGSAVMVVLMNQVTDVVYRLIDPRIRTA